MNEIVAQAKEFATELLGEKLSPAFTYHNLEHTSTVVEGVQEIGQAEALRAEEMDILLIAAWFHDTGYVHTQDEHEQESVRIATTFLKQVSADEALIAKVTACILATKPGSVPADKLQQVLRDADMFHLSKNNYFDRNNALRHEWAALYGKQYADLEWAQLNLEFLSQHQFATKYGKDHLAKEKEKIIKKIRKEIKKSGQKINAALIRDLGISESDLKELKKKLLKAENRPERGIETMFRLTSKNHIDLSGMADSKANIMISINSIIISVLLGGLMQKLDSNTHLIPPTIILLGVTLSSIVYSILSLRPNITSGKFTKEDIANHDTNLLFFGNFHKMKREDYHWGMNNLMENSAFLYSNLIDDIFFLGVVLAKKYQYLRRSYNIFMYGIVVAVFAFIVAILFFNASGVYG